jgi:peptidoglycan-associated lipoprotein
MCCRSLLAIVMLVLFAGASGCARRSTAVGGPPAPPPAAPPTAGAPAVPVPGPARVDDALPVPPEPLLEDELATRSLDDLNRDSPLKAVFFAFDSAELDDEARAVVQANAEILKRYPTWVVTIEGHCDERGTAEYNLALGERRANAVKTHLVALGISPDRIRTVSYGKEFPFDPGHNEEAWAKNRRGHFVITSK